MTISFDCDMLQITLSNSGRTSHLTFQELLFLPCEKNMIQLWTRNLNSPPSFNLHYFILSPSDFCAVGFGPCCCCFWGSHQGQTTESALKDPSSSSKTWPQRMWIRPLQPGHHFHNSCVRARQLLPSEHHPIKNDAIIQSCVSVKRKELKWGLWHRLRTWKVTPLTENLLTALQYTPSLTRSSCSIWNLKVSINILWLVTTYRAIYKTL